MALKDALKAGPPKPRYSDKLGSYRSAMSDEDRAAFDKMIADPEGWPHATLARVLTAEGYPISDAGVSGYRARAGIA